MKPVLVLMDFENEIVHEKGKYAPYGFAQYLKENNVFEHVQTVMEKARAQKIPIIFVKVGFSPDYKEWSPIPRAFRGAKENQIVPLGSWATEIHESLKVQPQDFVVVKHRINPFYSTDLEVILKSLQADTLYLAGVSTNYVVQSATREAHDRDYHVVLLEDCCGGMNKEDHQRAIESLNLLAAVKKSDQIAFNEKDLE